MRFIKVLFIILIIIFFAILYTQNMAMFTQEFELGLNLKILNIGPYITMNVVIILGAFVFGAVVAVIFGAMQSISSGAESKEKSRRIRELEARNRELVEDKQREDKLKKTDSSPFTPPSAIDSSSQSS